MFTCNGKKRIYCNKPEFTASNFRNKHTWPWEVAITVHGKILNGGYQIGWTWKHKGSERRLALGSAKIIRIREFGGRSVVNCYGNNPRAKDTLIIQTGGLSWKFRRFNEPAASVPAQCTYVTLQWGSLWVAAQDERRLLISARRATRSRRLEEHRGRRNWRFRILVASDTGKGAASRLW